MKQWLLTMCCLGILLTGCASQEPPTTTHLPRVACVGDSITQGFGGNCYPDIIAASNDIIVGNFGICGATAMTHPGASYQASGAYQESLDWHADIVVIMLGTNDTAYWQDPQTFATDYAALVDTYLAQGAKVALCTPLAPAPEATTNAYGINPHHYPALCTAICTIAQERNLPLIDIYTQTTNKNVTQTDHIHPNTTGAQLIANAIITQLQQENWL